MTNQEALKTAFSIIYTCEELKAYNTLEKAIDDLELKDKALDIVCEELKNHNIKFANSHIGICTEHCEELDDVYITQTKEDIEEYVLEQARKELSNGNNL